MCSQRSSASLWAECSSEKKTFVPASYPFLYLVLETGFVAAKIQLSLNNEYAADL